MAESKKKPASSPYLLYLFIALLLLSGAILLLPVYRDYQKKRVELSVLQKDLAEKQGRSAELNQETAELQTSPGAVEKVAREKFSLSREGETLLTYPKEAGRKENGGATGK
jgi:cell division protein FtsB